MKKVILSIIPALLLTSCGPSVKLIGTVNMISNRNVSTKESYIQVKSYSGDSKKELSRNKGKNVQEALDNLVRSVPGGEFVMNAKIYIIDTKYYSVSGDVWGLEQNQNYKGFKKGDRIMWKDNFVKYTGVITDLKDDKEATVKQDENGKIRTVRYDEMQKIE